MNIFNVTLSPSLASRIGISVFFYLNKTDENGSTLHGNEIRYFFSGEKIRTLNSLYF